MNYDIIGDIHGCAKSLTALLIKLGYIKKQGIYQKDEHQVIYLGDFIDRGPHQRAVIGIVRPMIDNEFALAIMGNHEYNAIAYATADIDKKKYLREHSVKNDKQHQAFLDEYPFKSLDYMEVIEWFKTLPLWLELDGLRVVHAGWNQDCMDRISAKTTNQKINDEFLQLSAIKETQEYLDIEEILKGKELPLPKGLGFKDKDGNKRNNIRVRWWDKSAKSYNKIFFGTDSDKEKIPDVRLSGKDLESIKGYASSEPPVFIGHYWLNEENMESRTANIACLDYSIAKPGGRLTAYRFKGEQKIENEHFVSVSRQED
ncbi:MAG: metallophosphoesterase [Gammaproteobacteria bacterium]|nr:metallophosphoesterase [Gammaproteobacteria bacterium]